jgi:hypothetical protein
MIIDQSVRFLVVPPWVQVIDFARVLVFSWIYSTI